MRPHGNEPVIELERSAIEPEFLHRVYEVLKVGNRDFGLAEEPDLELLEERSRNTRKEFFQVSTGALERK
jgi:hypothetical protein